MNKKQLVLSLLILFALLPTLSFLSSHLPVINSITIFTNGQILPVEYKISTIAGGSRGEGVKATNVGVVRPFGIALSSNGMLFFTETNGTGLVRIVNVSNSEISLLQTCAGGGSLSYSTVGVYGTANLAIFPKDPKGLVFGLSNETYVSDATGGIYQIIYDINEGLFKMAKHSQNDGYVYSGGMAIDPKTGTLYVAESKRIIKYYSKVMITIVSGAIYQNNVTASNTSTFPGALVFHPISGDLYWTEQDRGSIRYYSNSTGLVREYVASSALTTPFGLAIAVNGDMYVSEYSTNTIKKIFSNNQTIVTIANIAGAGFFKDGEAKSSGFQGPTHLVLNADGTLLYVADSLNNRVRKIDLVSNTVSTIAGDGTTVYKDGEGYLASQSVLSNPIYTYYNSKTDELLFADNYNNKIRKISSISTISSAKIYTVFGNGDTINAVDGLDPLTSPINRPTCVFQSEQSGDIFVGTQGLVYRIDNTTNKVRYFVGGSSTLYDGEGALAVSAQISNPYSVFASDLDQSIYFLDNSKIRKIDSKGFVKTIIGTGVPGDVDGIGKSAAIGLHTYSLAVHNISGDILIGDFDNNKVKLFKNSTGIVTTIAGNGFKNVTLDNVSGTATSLIPGGVLFLSSEEFLISDALNMKVRKLTNGTISTIIGDGGFANYKDNVGPFASSIGPGGIALHPITGDLYIADYQFHCVRKYSFSTFKLVTVMGNGTKSSESSIQSGSNAATSLNTPTSLAFAPNGDLYVSVRDMNQIVKLASGSSTLEVAVGTGDQNYNGDYLDGSKTNIGQPYQITYQNGYIIFGEKTNSRLRRYNIATKKVETIAGGFGDYTIGTNAIINSPSALAIDTDRNDLYIADSQQNRVRKISLNSNTITTAIGNSYTGEITTLVYFQTDGKLASINTPLGLAYAGSGQLFMSETGNNVLDTFNVSTNIVTLLAGTILQLPAISDNAGQFSPVYTPQSIAILPGGEYVFAETGSHIIRKVNSNRLMNRIAGTFNTPGFSGDSDNARNATLNSPKGLSVLKDGRIAVSDSGNNRIRLLTPYCNSGYQMINSPNGVLECYSYCFGISFNASNVCSGRGVCTSPDTCVCRAGYDGADCSLTKATLLGTPNYVLLSSNSLVVSLDLAISKLKLASQTLVDEFLNACTKSGVPCSYKMDYSISSSLVNISQSQIVVSPFNLENGIISLSPAFMISKLNLNSIPLANNQANFKFYITNAVGNKLYFTFSIDLVLPLSSPSSLFTVQAGNGVAIKDNFTITINEWIGVVSSMLPLRYAIGILPTQIDSTIRLTPFSENRNVTFVLPFLKTTNDIHVLSIYVMDANGNIYFKTSNTPIIVKPFSGSSQEIIDMVNQPQNLNYNLLTALTYDRSFENITDSKYYSALISNIVIDTKDITTPLNVINYLATKSMEQNVVEGTLSKLSEIVQKVSDYYNKSRNDVGYVTSKIASSNVDIILNLTSSIWSIGYSVNNTRELMNNLASLLLIGEIPSVLSNSSTISPTSYASSNINLTISSFRINSLQESINNQLLSHSSLQVQFNPSYIISKYSALTVDCGVSLITFSSNVYGTDYVSNNSDIVRNSTSSISDFKFLKNLNVLQLENLDNPIVLTFAIENLAQTANLLTSPSNSTIYNLTCAYLDETSLKWNNQGCSLKRYDLEKGIISCSCNHTTLFTTFLEQKTLQLSEKTKQEVASLYYGQISLGIFYLLISTVVLILVIMFRNTQPLSSRLSTPYLGMIALITESLLIYIVQRSVLVDQLFKDSTNWASGDLASNWIANIVMIFVNTLNLTAILAYLIQVCRYQLMKYLYNILHQVRKNQSTSQESLLKNLRRFTSNKLVNGILIGFAILNVFYWTLWVILRRCNVIYPTDYTYIISISYIVIIFTLSALITCISVGDFVVSMIKQHSSNKKSKEESKKTKIDLQDVKDKISSMGIHKWIVSMDSPLYFRGEMLLYILFFILLIINQSLGLSTLPFRYETEESYRNVLTNDMIAFIFETLYVAVYILVFGGYPLLIIISNKIKFKLRRRAQLTDEQDEDENKELLQVIGNSYGKSLMEEFCKKEFSTENLYLYSDLQENQHLIVAASTITKELADFITKIYNNHIKAGSAMEVNIPSSCSKQFIKLYKSVENQNIINNSSQDLEMVDLKKNNSIMMKEEGSTVDVCFRDLKDNVIINLSDTFSRFVLTEEYTFFSQVFDFANTNLAKSLNI